MPYPTLASLPDAVKALPKHAQEIFQGAFNAAFKQYEGDEAKSAATAWAAVKTKYEKKDDKWVAKEAVHPHGEHTCVCPECDKEITVEENIKCNTQSCPECKVRMRAKDIGERRTKEAIMANELSDTNKANLLQQGLTTEYGLDVDNTIPRGVWVEEVFESEVIYNVNGQSYKASYTMEDGKATFGEPEKVIRQTVYKPMESLRTTYSEIIQEAGRRNANIDSTRVKKIMALCQELLSSEDEVSDGKIKKAVKEAGSVLTWLKEQAVVKTEDSIEFPAEAYAYVPDSEKSTTWKLRLWEDSEKKVTKAQLGRATAALSPGGFRGQKVAIPAADLSAVKRKIRAAYRKLGVEDDDIPRWVKETETQKL